MIAGCLLAAAVVVYIIVKRRRANNASPTAETQPDAFEQVTPNVSAD